MHQQSKSQLIDTRTASAIIGIRPLTLKQSRYTGILFGKPTPTYVKLGRNVRYKIETIRSFIESFPEVGNTSQGGCP